MTLDLTKDKRIRVIIGHYGSGKTEFAVNYALMLSKQTTDIALCDLDIVNPYFRSREKAGLLEQNDIRVFSGAFGHESNLDLPMLSASLVAPLQNPNTNVILDVGGDDVGARVLVQYRAYLTPGAYDMLCVVNAYRKDTQSVMDVVSHIRNIEDACGVKVTGLINNTHLLRETTPEDVMLGQALVVEVSEKLNLPIFYVSTLEKVTHQLPKDIEGGILPIKMIMREDWM